MTGTRRRSVCAPSRVSRFLALLVLVGTFILPSSAWSEPRTTKGNGNGEAASFLKEKLTDMSGKKVSLEDYLGKVTIVNFWCTWCGPCRKELKTLSKLYEKHKGKGLQIVAVSLDWQGISVVEPFVKKERISYPVLVGNLDGFEQCCNITIIPTTLFLDAEGNIVTKLLGNRDEEVLESTITSLISGTTSETGK